MRQRIEDRVDVCEVGLADHSTISRLSIKAIVGFTAFREETETEKLALRGLHTLYCIIFWYPEACNNRMTVVSNK